MEIQVDTGRQPVMLNPEQSSLLPPKGPEPTAPVIVVDTAGLVERTFQELLETFRHTDTRTHGPLTPTGVQVRQTAAASYRRAVHQHARATGRKLPVPGIGGLTRLWG
jgi:hypothetical protein